jgi:uncharacterized protein YggE
VGVEARAGTAANASNQAGRRTDAVRQAIRARGFPIDSVRVVRFDVSPNFDYQRERRLVDYSARATVQVTVRPLDRLGAVLDTALAAGAGEIQSIEFRSDSMKVARAGALARALAQARSDAETLALAAGGTLGRLILVETAGGDTPMFKERIQMSALAERGGAPPVERDVVVSVSVSAKWEFVRAGRAP